jgi:hypothetical protein
MSGRGKIIGLFSLVALLMLGILLVTGCTKSEEKATEKEENVEGTAVDESGSESKVDPSGKQKIMMMGRSVMGGWFEHWGSDSSYEVSRDGYYLYYKELETPPEIVKSAKEFVDEIDDDKTIVFFKFCFDDFWAGDRTEAKSNLADNKKYIREVYKAVVEEHGLKLIIGNALPKVKDATDSNLVWDHRSFNKWLEEFAQEHAGEVYIFDQYSVLTDAKGNLKSGFSLESGDSHLNDEAYTALDNAFFSFLDENFK